MFNLLNFFLFKRRRQKYLDDIYKTEDPWSSVLHLPALTEFFELQLAVNYRAVLDVGCGEGLFSKLLRSRAEYYCGFDVSASAVKRAREKNKNLTHVDFCVGDYSSFETDRTTYDLVVFNFVLDYLGFQKFPKKFSTELFSFLKKNAAVDAHIVIINPVYSGKNTEDFANYLFMFRRFGWSSAVQKIYKFQGYEVVCCVLKPNKVEPNGSGV